MRFWFDESRGRWFDSVRRFSGCEWCEARYSYQMLAFGTFASFTGMFVAGAKRELASRTCDGNHWPAFQLRGRASFVHFGRPDAQKGVACEGFQMLLRLLQNGRTWVKVSAAYRLGRPAAAAYGRELLRRCGPERLLWASDCPFVGHEKEVAYRDTIDDVLAWLPEGAARDKVLYANAMALYFS